MTTATIKIIDRTDHDGLVTEVIERNGKCYAEETKPVFGGAISRRTKMYSSVEAYGRAWRDGRLAWRRWI